MRENSGLAEELLASLEGLCFMQQFSKLLNYLVSSLVHYNSDAALLKKQVYTDDLNKSRSFSKS